MFVEKAQEENEGDDDDEDEEGDEGKIPTVVLSYLKM